MSKWHVMKRKYVKTCGSHFSMIKKITPNRSEEIHLDRMIMIRDIGIIRRDMKFPALLRM